MIRSHVSFQLNEMAMFYPEGFKQAKRASLRGSTTLLYLLSTTKGASPSEKQRQGRCVVGTKGLEPLSPVFQAGALPVELCPRLGSG